MPLVLSPEIGGLPALPELPPRPVLPYPLQLPERPPPSASSGGPSRVSRSTAARRLCGVLVASIAQASDIRRPAYATLHCPTKWTSTSARRPSMRESQASVCAMRPSKRCCTTIRRSSKASPRRLTSPTWASARDVRPSRRCQRGSSIVPGLSLAVLRCNASNLSCSDMGCKSAGRCSSGRRRSSTLARR